MKKDIQDILNLLTHNLKNAYNQRLKGILLFGSYANGTARPESDLDLGLIIDDFGDIGKEIENTGEIASSISLKNNIVISLHPIREKDWNDRKTPFILNLKKEGIRIQ